ncbi:hypothetical protein CALVIDRAFT_552080 [Calocera viscosa TUFC12733]|uniref:Protein kinase domain-containing protein n=1 Tax=Calocera viscosa (strain TUFC12733) TaxID=1330018 RepID=A0A167SC31_CALVF|nr:hypothetical protein CALVIDRAFT_552080 [Calocera viscosa TUFC12733]
MRKNIMMLPGPSGPLEQHLPAAQNVSYCYIDFGFASQFEPGAFRARMDPSGPALAPPELKTFRFDPKPPGYDPFPLDIWMLGGLLKDDLLYSRSNLDVLLPLADAMLEDNYTTRPTGDTALNWFRAIVGLLSESDFHKSTMTFTEFWSSDPIINARLARANAINRARYNL